jgi:hypothetical protein
MNRGSGDIYSHIFVANQISTSGYVPQTDIYPIMHIWLSISYNFFLNYFILGLLLSIVFFIFYILSLYILGKSILGSIRGGIFVSIFGIPLIFSFLYYSFIPFFFGLLLVPLILYTYQKISRTLKQQSGFYICLTFLSLFIVFCHPMVIIFLIIMFSIFAFYELFKRLKGMPRPSKIVAINIVAIVGVTFIFWLFQFRGLLSSLQKIISALSGQMENTSIIDYQMNIVMTSNASIWLIVERFIKIYGPICLYFLISSFFLLYIIYQFSQNKKICEDDLIYSLQFCVAICIGIALVTGYFVIFEPIRAVMYGLIFATILCGLFFYRIWFFIISDKKIAGYITSITIIITIVCMLAMFTIYPSPWIGSTSPALTKGDKTGFDWILEYKNAEIPIVTEELSMNKYSDYYYESISARNIPNLIEHTEGIPSHFGYTTNQTIGDSFAYFPEKNLYMITTELMKLAPYAVPIDRRNLIKSFTDTEFTRLKNDPSVNLIYSGEKFGVWNINIR